jgi:hypothetical protein
MRDSQQFIVDPSASLRLRPWAKRSTDEGGILFCARLIFEWARHEPEKDIYQKSHDQARGLRIDLSQLFLLINILYTSYQISKRATALLPNYYLTPKSEDSIFANQSVQVCNLSWRSSSFDWRFFDSPPSFYHFRLLIRTLPPSWGLFAPSISSFCKIFWFIEVSYRLSRREKSLQSFQQRW